MTDTQTSHEQAAIATDRLIRVAEGDTHQSKRVADFLLAWWNGDDLGHFPIQHLWNVDRAISADMLTVMSYLTAQPCAVYADALGERHRIEALVDQWRGLSDAA